MAVSLAIGLIAGTASGLLGIGGGILLVPAIMLGMGHSLWEAKAESLFVILGTSTVGAVTHRRHDNVNLRLGALLGGTGIVGAAAGYVVSTWTPTSVFMSLFGVLLGAVALQLWINGDLVGDGETPDPPARVVVPLGLSAGFVSAFFGVGGGILFVPVMVVAGVPMHLAVGTSLVGVFVNGASGLALYSMDGHLQVASAAIVLVGALVGARLGAKYANRVPAGDLKRVFAAGLALAGVYLAAQPWI